MEFIKTIPEKQIVIVFENLTIDKYGNVKTVYTRKDQEGNVERKSIKINIFDENISDESKHKYRDICYDNILNNLNVDISEFNFEQKESV